MMFTLGVNGGPTYSQRTVRTRELTPGVVETLSDVTEQKTVSVAAYVSNSGLLELVFGGGWALQAANLELLSESVTLLGTRTRTTTLSWSAVAPEFPPDDTVGGT